ncbi:MAG: outer membrane lipoprotein carrier protein LolA [Paraburkholderia sp.]|uniref:outer membrane lipoprotein carrier protein LolA n=1 Tax=Paraburkholderia sp. TaxID=1926495 RepID=UPI0012108857|nr:outer membrane lipoprotein carrier protein LolA [Paraburkholderia sp.]TAM07803.1 MAG: outer membrane lipoprotein carrier protein LolA [Paraburkholderia sp.]TAM31522.1 MAG: outer membrane lipoprotein carrier protein LolA [Paraburkholderia sp.]
MTPMQRPLPVRARFATAAVALSAVAAAVSLALPCGAVAAAPANAPDASNAPNAWTLDRLMATLAQNRSGHATFTETKYLSIASRPVESSGELMFAAPDHLEKRTLSPTPEDLVVEGNRVTVARGGHRYTLALDQYPEVAAFIESIRATLDGNRYTLEQLYKVAIAGQGDGWTLTLTPLDARMLKVVSTITLDGTRDQLQSVTIRQADGDHSVMRLRDASARAR